MSERDPVNNKEDKKAKWRIWRERASHPCQRVSWRWFSLWKSSKLLVQGSK